MIRRMIRRTAMRALLFDEQREEILLIKALVPDTGVELWFTPGGGMEPDETDLACLAREVLEETGLTELPPAHLVWTRREQFVFMGDDYDQAERYYLVPIARFEVANRALESHEAETFLAARWWRLADIVASTDSFVPGDLGKQLGVLAEQLRTGRLPGEPLHVGR